MPNHQMTFEMMRDAVEASALFPDSQNDAAEHINISRGALQGRLRAAKRHGIVAGSTPPQPEPSAPPPPPPLSRPEVHDAKFWRAKHQAVLEELAAVEHIAERLAGVRDVPYQIPDWLPPAPDEKRGRSVIGCLLSDVHMGEKIDAGEILGINEFNEAICRARLRRYFAAVCSVGLRWASDTDCQGVLLALAGDLISGDIHEELRITNDLTAHEQVRAMVEECSLGIKMLRETFGAVHIICVPGNHGRNTPKPTAKLYARLSYDMMIGAMLEREFHDAAEITFQISAAKDQITPVFGRSVFTTHGDKIGTKGGMGFAGPILPIVRGSKKIEAQQASVGRMPDLIQFGHYHTTSNPGNVLSNGSVPGYSEYSDDLRSAVEPPRQWAYLLHSKWWLRERVPIQLEEPVLPEKPRVRVPISWGGEV